MSSTSDEDAAKIVVGVGGSRRNDDNDDFDDDGKKTNTITTLQTQVSSNSGGTGGGTDSTTNTNPSTTGTDTTTTTTTSKPYAILLIQGPDQTGIVASFAQTLAGHGCSIYDAEQSTDRSAHLFFQRIRFDYSNIVTDKYTLETNIQELCNRLNMKYIFNWGTSPKKIAIFVSKYDHCLWELLLRYRANEFNNTCTISMIVSNHNDLQYIADTFNIPYYVFPITKDNKIQQENNEIQLLQDNNIDLIVLARYMQIISNNFCTIYQYKIINIHHSFLPAFIGSRPYHRAHERGVKLIGATAHYATTNLDEGPIIEQDTIRISHRNDVNDLIRTGRILEKNVLVSAVQAHVEDRIIVYNNKCIIFGSS